MITDIEIENFKTFRHIELHDLKRMTLISGRNNIGKSTLLEALFLYMDHLSGESFQKLNGFRSTAGMSAENLWEPLFYQMNTENPVLIAVTDDGRTGCLKYERDEQYLPFSISGLSEEILASFRTDTRNSYSLSCRFTENDYEEYGHFSLNGNGVLRDFSTSLPGNENRMMKMTRFMNNLIFRKDILVNDAGKAELSGEKQELVRVLQEMDSSIEDIVTLSVHGTTQLYIRTAGRLMPLQYAGDGIIKLLSICLSVMCVNNGLVLIDEIESGFHYSMYGKLWKLIDHISQKANCQVIATTHSYELISGVMDNISHNDDFCYYRIGRKKENPVACRFDYPMLHEALVSEMEVR